MALSTPHEMKILSVLENLWKTEIELFQQCTISHENWSLSQIILWVIVNKACFQHYMAYENIKDLPRQAASD